MKPFITVAAVKDTFSVAFLIKILFDMASIPIFTAAELLDPIPVPTSPATPSTAPYVNSFTNFAVALGASNRLMLSEYFYTYGRPGTSRFWVYDPTVQGWSLVFSDADGSVLTLPRNPQNVVNLALDSTDAASLPYLLASDWDSDNGTLATSNVTLLGMDAHDLYTLISHLDYVYPDDPSYVAHCQDVVVTKDQAGNKRVFALYLVNDPNYTSYMSSVLVEVLVTPSTSGPPTLSFGQFRDDLGANARQIVPYVVGGTLQLFVPCIGGPIGTADQGNLGLSVLQAVDASAPILGKPQTLLTGADSTSGTSVVAGQDISGLAISSTGNAYVLTTLYANSSDLRSKLYSTTVAALLQGRGTPIADWTPAKSTFARNSYFAAVACGRPDGAASDYFAYVYGTRPTTYQDILPADEMVIWQDGQAIGSGTVITTAQLTGNTSNDVTLNSMAISVAGGLRPRNVKSAHAGSIGAPTPPSGGGEPDEE
jgi:hypothetical protein